MIYFLPDFREMGGKSINILAMRKLVGFSSILNRENYLEF